MGDLVTFINEAIEWENLVYYLYSYFWDIPASWDFIRQIRHPDSTRQAFLRAGGARVVVPIRKGYEAAWVNYVRTGTLSKLPGVTPPYMPIAEEIYLNDLTNYPGIPPANPEGQTTTVAATGCTANLTPSDRHVEIPVVSSAGFIAGYIAVIDTGAVAERQPIIKVGPQSITVRELQYAHDGADTEFLVTQDNETGMLIANGTSTRRLRARTSR